MCPGSAFRDDQLSPVINSHFRLMNEPYMNNVSPNTQWIAHIEEENAGHTQRVQIDHAGAMLTYAEVIALWQTDPQFCTFFNDLLANAPFSAMRWETPPITSTTATRCFECVLLNSPGLTRAPEPDAFAEHLHRSPEASVVAFTNLGGDAILIAPQPQSALDTYVHLAPFVRNAPAPQRQALWQQVGNTMARRLNERPVWLSTAGGGVAWLHVRLDDRPKYYGYFRYRQFP